MADDWIKMRSDLYRDPKVLVIADDLMRPDGELARYVNQNMQRDMSVTRNVMRNVTVGALVSVWGVMRRRGKRFGDDLTVTRVTLSVLDDISDLPGFGEAMAASGWVKQVDSGLVFPNFFEDHNSDPREKGRERQRRYRERHGSVTRNVTPGVTRNVTVTPREEKRREEKSKKKKTPLPPLEFPAALDSDRCRKALDEWLAHRERIGKRYKSAVAVGKLLAEWAAKGEAAFVAAVEFSIAREYQGLFSPGGGRGAPNALDAAAERERQLQAAGESWLRKREGDGDPRGSGPDGPPVLLDLREACPD